MTEINSAWKENWTPFYILANGVHDMVTNRTIWECMVSDLSMSTELNWPAAELFLLDNARLCESGREGALPNYGFYDEHTGPTLGKFFADHGMAPSFWPFQAAAAPAPAAPACG